MTGLHGPGIGDDAFNGTAGHKTSDGKHHDGDTDKGRYHQEQSSYEIGGHDMV